MGIIKQVNKRPGITLITSVPLCKDPSAGEPLSLSTKSLDPRRPMPGSNCPLAGAPAGLGPGSSSASRTPTSVPAF